MFTTIATICAVVVAAVFVYAALFALVSVIADVMVYWWWK